jgi:hypothetical protein
MVHKVKTVGSPQGVSVLGREHFGVQAMKSHAFDQTKPLQRRGLLIGAGVAGVAAVAAKTLPVAPTAVAAAAAQPAAAAAAGYQLTPHVLRYYETTKV